MSGNGPSSGNDHQAADASFFRPVNGSRAFQEVVDQLTYAIRSGVYGPGTRLPTTDELAKAMGVSRPTIGEAIRVLADAGVLRTRRGAAGGVTVASWTVPPAVLRLASDRRARALPDLAEARRPIEMELARLAALRATEADFEDLRAAVRLLEKLEPTSHQWLQADSLFHYGIGRAARSALLAYYQHEVLEEMALLLDNFDPKFYEPQTVIVNHQRTLAALETRDPALVAAAMDDHLRELEELAQSCDPLAVKVKDNDN